MPRAASSSIITPYVAGVHSPPSAALVPTISLYFFAGRLGYAYIRESAIDAEEHSSLASNDTTNLTVHYDGWRVDPEYTEKDVLDPARAAMEVPITAASSSSSSPTSNNLTKWTRS